MSQSKVSGAILPGRLAKLARPTRMLWLGPLLGFTLSIPFFFTGYKLDDYLFAQQSLDKTVYHARASWDYFNWASSATEVAQYRERGIIVDWFTPDAFRFRPFRPLASLVHAWQFRHLAHAPWAMHVSLALLYALLILLCAKLLMRFSTSATAVGIGVLLFAIDDSHAFSSGWISAYNTLLCCLFGLFALFMHDRWRRDKSSLGLTFSVASFVLALLSSEGGLALMGYLVAYAIFVESGSWRKKAASMIPAVLIAAGYLLFYAMYHFGPRCFVAYVSASDDPWLAVFAVLSNTVLFTVSQVVSLAPLTVTRTGERTLTATVPNGWIASDFERSRRPRQLHFTPGQSIDLQLMTATIEKVTCDARPLSVTFAFKEELSAFAWMKWEGREPEQCGLPAIGGQMRLWAPLF